ncbi:MAG: hypothetical protein WC026_16445 [Hyphomicrobium sp.]|jgi:hypothetical protein|uniref:hypothetical protein n=1 Tax=Hyphomicrobium sp. TaxID=82 RepID=UPI0035680520
MVNIKLNKELDYEIYKDFWDFKTAGVDFGMTIQKEHPLITLDNHKEYIDKFYSTNQTALNSVCSELQLEVSEKQEVFFDALRNLFEIDFRNKNYTGFLSIFNCNPRFVESKTFQVFYKKDIPHKIEVIFHEIMHFAFFDYCEKNLKYKIKGMDTNSGPLWELSEIFNIIVLNEPKFKSLLGMEEKLFYSDLKEKCEVVKKIWSEEKENLLFFLEKSIDYINSTNLSQ